MSGAIPSRQISRTTEVLGVHNDAVLGDKPTLKDQYGLWCASCFKYIDHEPYEWYDVSPARILKVLEIDSKNLEYEVPVHKDSFCKEWVETISKEVEKKLKDDFITAKKLKDTGYFEQSDNMLDSKATKAWRRGSLNESLCYRELALKIFNCVPSILHKHLNLELNVAAGTQAAKRFKGLIYYPGFIVGKNERDPSPFLNAANLAANLGYVPETKELVSVAYDIINRLPSSERFEFLPSKARRDLLISLDEREIKTAISFEREHTDSYGRRTTKILSGMIFIANKKYSLARNDFDFINLFISDPEVSWWHKYEFLLGTACAMYQQEKDWQEASARLQAAQYILVCLGLNGPPIPDIRLGTKISRAILYPNDLLEWISEQHPKKLLKEFLQEQRIETLRDIKTGIMKSLSVP